MIQPKPGEVYWVDLGMAGKVRPLMVVSREDPDSSRALAVCVPLTTEIRGVANVHGITAIEYRRLGRKSGCFQSAVVASARKAIAWMLELENPSA
jgi:mRNA interferase MazF